MLDVRRFATVEGPYRYWLEQRLDGAGESEPALVFGALNPSVARCGRPDGRSLVQGLPVGCAKASSAGACSTYAFIATKPKIFCSHRTWWVRKNEQSHFQGGI